MNLQKYSLEGKTALITGASGLLGQQHAKALLELGANIILTDITSCSGFQSNNTTSSRSKILELYLDVTDENSICSAADELSSKNLDVDVLINNAAINPKVSSAGLSNTSRFEDFSTSQWDLELNVGLKGAFLCSKIFGSRMAERNSGGVILNIASDLSVIAPDQRIYSTSGQYDDHQPVKPITYSVIKAGLVGLTKYIATYWPHKNIRCNSLSPGGVFNGQNSSFLDRVTSLIPLSRMANIDEYKSAVQFLCSDASSYMTGQNIVIDGGRSIW